jgi:hypothetical protein
MPAPAPPKERLRPTKMKIKRGRDILCFFAGATLGAGRSLVKKVEAFKPTARRMALKVVSEGRLSSFFIILETAGRDTDFLSHFIVG